MDGATRSMIFWRIMLPLSLPAVAVTALFSFMTAWNEFILAAVFMNSEESYTLPVGLNTMVGEHTTEWGHFAAGAIPRQHSGGHAVLRPAKAAGGWPDRGRSQGMTFERSQANRTRRPARPSLGLDEGRRRISPASGCSLCSWPQAAVRARRASRRRCRSSTIIRTWRRPARCRCPVSRLRGSSTPSKICCRIGQWRRRTALRSATFPPTAEWTDRLPAERDVTCACCRGRRTPTR